jgi:nucleoside-diphosphate-sugar epimerase
MDERHPLAPINTYAVSKLAADRMCFTFHHEHGVPVVIARIFNAYGPRETQPYVIPEIITQLDKSPVLELGNVDAERDFTYVSDTAKALIATMISDVPAGEAVNIGSNQSYSVRDLVARIARIMGRESYEIRTDPKRLRRFDIMRFQCDYSRLHAATGWRPSVAIDDGLKRTVDWFMTHGRRWSWENWVDGTLAYDAVS